MFFFTLGLWFSLVKATGGWWCRWTKEPGMWLLLYNKKCFKEMFFQTIPSSRDASQISREKIETASERTGMLTLLKKIWSLFTVLMWRWGLVCLEVSVVNVLSFQIVHRTLAAMLGSLAALAALSIIGNVSLSHYLILLILLGMQWYLQNTLWML